MLNRLSLEIWAGVRIDIFLCPRNFWKFGQRFPSYPSHFRHGYMFLTTCVVGGYGVYILDNWYWEYTCSVSLVCSTDWWLLVKFLQCKSVLQRTEARPRNFWKFGQRFPSYPSHFRHGYMFLTTCVVGGYGVYILDNWYWEYTCSVSLVCSTDWWLLVKFLQCKSVLQRTEARRQGFILVYWVYIGVYW